MAPVGEGAGLPEFHRCAAQWILEVSLLQLLSLSH